MKISEKVDRAITTMLIAIIVVFLLTAALSSCRTHRIPTEDLTFVYPYSEADTARIEPTAKPSKLTRQQKLDNGGENPELIKRAKVK